MKKRLSLTPFLILLLFLIFLSLPQRYADLPEISFQFFRRLFQEPGAQEAFGLEEEEYIAVFSEEGESVFL